MYYWILISKRIRKLRHDNRELITALIFFCIALTLLNIVMVSKEGLDLFSSLYFSFVTATTVGYGDISPSTITGKLASVVYMLVSIGALGTVVGVITSKAFECLTRRRKGLIVIKDRVDLLIIGYPNEAKVHQIVREFRQDPRFSNSVIVVVTNRLEERPSWMAEEDVFFVKGLASKKEVLERANIQSVSHILVLANEPFDEVSDEFSSSAVSMSERLNPHAYTVAEKVREDSYLFQIAECDRVVSVSRPGELVQELQDPGAIEFAECIFSNQNEGNQYNITVEKDITWGEVVLDLLDMGGTAIGHKNPGESGFNFTPGKDDALRFGAAVKYIARSQLGPFAKPHLLPDSHVNADR